MGQSVHIDNIHKQPDKNHLPNNPMWFVSVLLNNLSGSRHDCSSGLKSETGQLSTVYSLIQQLSY